MDYLQTRGSWVRILAAANFPFVLTARRRRAQHAHVTRRTCFPQLLRTFEVFNTRAIIRRLLEKQREYRELLALWWPSPG